jgi:hypothetical protein
VLKSYANFNAELPVICIGGKRFSGCAGILRFAGKKARLHSADPVEALAIDSIVDTITDLLTPLCTLASPKRYGFPAYAKGSAGEKNHHDFIIKAHFPRFVTALGNTISAGENGFAVGGRLTIADLAIFSMVFIVTHEVGYVWPSQPFRERLRQKSKICILLHILGW